jgi:hypothetical protein
MHTLIYPPNLSIGNPKRKRDEQKTPPFPPPTLISNPSSLPLKRKIAAQK